AVVVEHLNARVSGVGGVDVALRVDRDAVDVRELAGRGPFLTPRLHEHAVFRELGDARVAAAVGDENIALRVPRDVGRTVEDVLRRARAGSAASAPAAAFTATARTAGARRI